ncbi:AMP-binding protein [Nodularia spumigena CS-584]|jgi:long-chain acyl-CoA synthetase|uniref:AMP-binding protein n=1 Tax=Nodularia spumigena UHCC 0060 TaxID=3110300 RepID=A0ABU5USD9_NODSP|nr:AMP-binding protein [Nodularia spumigena]AHJ26688.1 Long-chain-fatty-acid--CoA ligase [Nodularia spumigena CCY9414]MDB9381036.1 AMP-binding protein [Nodularia spumigena CS-584]MEA5526199.1 AMP-binding protein [Nodularia spumigena UHCC 0143]MEA5607990.1 AMP-binding protein [Nodularia spumigena UHCC 0060]MEA5612622.1 AMP-binding protein [Nodularia spumigena UHCC 0040]
MNSPSFVSASSLTLEQQTDYSSVKTLPEIWSIAAQRFSNVVAVHDPHAKPDVSMTYIELWEQIQQFAAGLQSLGVSLRAKVGLFSENNLRWLIADQGIMVAGAVDAVRSSQASQDELIYILRNSEATALVVENQATLNKLVEQIHDLPIKLAIVLSDEEVETHPGLKVLNFSQIMEIGSNQTFSPVEQTRESLATLVYTSGTTGQPKATMLSHGNLLHQVSSLAVVVQLEAGDRVLSILPTWHIYERVIEYFAFSQGCTLIYTNLRHFKQDLKVQKPQYFVSVPRLLESIHDEVHKQFRQESAQKRRLINYMLAMSDRYIRARRIVHRLSLEQQNPSMWQRQRARTQTAILWPIHALADRLIYKKVREQIGAELKQTICGGGSLSPSLETFYEIIGIEVLVGYGLTETAAALTTRRPEHNLRGSAGIPIPGTEIWIVDPKTRKTLPQGEKGLVLARGPQIMQGYYHNPEATNKAINPKGWFNTEDLGFLTAQQDLVLTGREKDTIVLSNGENVEPEPIENACLRSDYIDQIVVVGQDRRSLGALIVPNWDNLEEWAENQGLQLNLDSQPVQNLFRQELDREVRNRPGYSSNDRIVPFRLISEPFSQENGMLTQTLKIKRHVVTERYSDLINEMFA